MNHYAWVFLGSAFLFGVNFGLMSAFTWMEWKKQNHATRARFLLLDLMFAILIYGFIESFALGVDLSPRHWVYLAVSIFGFGVLIYSYASAAGLTVQHRGMTIRDEEDIEIYDPTLDPSSYEPKPEQVGPQETYDA